MNTPTIIYILHLCWHIAGTYPPPGMLQCEPSPPPFETREACNAAFQEGAKRIRAAGKMDNSRCEARPTDDSPCVLVIMSRKRTQMLGDEDDGHPIGVIRGPWTCKQCNEQDRNPNVPSKCVPGN